MFYYIYFHGFNLPNTLVEETCELPSKMKMVESECLSTYKIVYRKKNTESKYTRLEYSYRFEANSKINVCCGLYILDDGLYSCRMEESIKDEISGI